MATVSLNNIQKLVTDWTVEHDTHTTPMLARMLPLLTTTTADQTSS